jgi:ribose transport system ATP-binding protein
MLTRPTTDRAGADGSVVALAATGVHKQFGGIHALEGADLTIAAGEVHAILGENGAGKSTLVKIIAGVVRPDRGRIVLGDEPLEAGSPQAARAAGIETVYQELSLVPELSVMHNLVLADLPGRAGLFSRKGALQVATNALAALGLDHIDPRVPVGRLPLDQQQMVEIAKATIRQPRILILDEATSSLGAAEVDRLFELVRTLRERGTTILVITHRMSEVWSLADSMTILRDGRTIGRYEVGEIDQQRVVTLMAGRDVRQVFPSKRSGGPSDVALTLRDVRLRKSQEPWSIDLRHGEILGLGGLQGQGQRHFLQWLYGYGPGSGDIIRDGKPLRIRKPGDALRHGIVLIPEDRGVEGLHLGLPIRWNLAMATLGDRSRVGIIRMAAEAQFARSAVERMGIKSSSPYQEVSALSGGTQQKVVIGKFIATRPKVLLFVDSTRGIDVHTKFEFYEMLRDLARSGAVCVVYSSDTEELVGLCDRVAVFHDGAPALMLEGNEVTQDAVVAASFAVAKGTA